MSLDLWVDETFAAAGEFGIGKYTTASPRGSNLLNTNYPLESVKKNDEKANAVCRKKSDMMIRY
jgi:hypothetical protein